MIVPLHQNLPFTDDPYLIDLLRALSDGLYEHARGINQLETITRAGNYQYVQPADGATVAMADATQVLILEPSAQLNALTVVLPAHPIDAAIARLTSTQAVVALTLQTVAGQTIANTASALAAGEPIGFIYKPSTWYRV
jgi:hypothetical protein